MEEEVDNVSYTIINDTVRIDPGSDASSYETESEDEQDYYSNCVSESRLEQANL